MNFAIFISGQCRKLNRTKLNKAFESVNKDFYIHSWIDDKHNPHWNKLENFFPDAKIKLESYQDKFDIYSNYRLVSDVDKLRYEFAQFYTVLQSFRQYKGDSKHDFYFRTRTDISYQTDLLDFFDVKHAYHEQLRRWTWHALKQTQSEQTWRELVPDDLETLLVNNDILDNRVFNLRPIVWSRMRMLDPKVGLVFDDFSWTMNEKAFNILRNADVDMIVKKAMDIKIDSGYTVQSPVIWSKVMTELGIHLIDAPISGNIIRAKAEEQNLVPYYGDIT